MNLVIYSGTLNLNVKLLLKRPIIFTK